ncbi:DEAD/DEAH box helicase [Thermobifida cellulosilytica]|uniref:DEAD/DEAH box helicase n=1 Tax=Thermobifida cellulosilytica TB100 TaxID=665004 RepID=A0A147KM51_THECS|nr:DEAD/DEAH box helicase [Thermobifida cellulosilytica]KUP98356.1 hypothetical protein AC529_01825 [Thermobifida cellulosilytica TB100]
MAASGTVPGYRRLHRGVQRWLWEQGWTGLRDIQERAIGPVLDERSDVILVAATASGKTEAAFLPVCSALAERSGGHGIRALYVSPLKALINDQYARLTDLCRHIDVPVHRWHGDVAEADKKAVLRTPDGILLITPESLEALFVRRGHAAARVFAGLDYVVVDELHALMGTERGAQMQSLLHRVELLRRRRVPRIGLSATLGDFSAAADFLRPGERDRVRVIVGKDAGQRVRLAVRGYLDRQAPGDDGGGPGRPAAESIADDLWAALRGGHNLVFANTRAAVEEYTDRLARRSRRHGLPDEFLPHHGSLSKELREEAEARLKDGTRPATAVCTATLEMGIDIGLVDTVAQLGAPDSVAGLRQRLGRSGRRGRPATLRVYVAERENTPETPPGDMLRTGLFQTVAMVDLLLERWYEPPDTGRLHLSTLIQQVLSVIAQRGGARARELYDTLCGSGPFHRVDASAFARLLRSMARHDLLVQEEDGLLLPGEAGEELLNRHDFYAAFTTVDEYRLVNGAQTLGSMPVDNHVGPGSLLVFGGRRWQVVEVDPRQKVVVLRPGGGGRPPVFTGADTDVSDGVRARMRRLYTGRDVPRYLDATAQDLLAEGRGHFHRMGLADRTVYAWGSDLLVFPWRGDRVMNTLALLLRRCGLTVGDDGAALTVSDTRPQDLWRTVRELAAGKPPEPWELAAQAVDKAVDKHDRYLDDELLVRSYAARALDLESAWEVVRAMAAEGAAVSGG